MAVTKGHWMCVIAPFLEILVLWSTAEEECEDNTGITSFHPQGMFPALDVCVKLDACPSGQHFHNINVFIYIYKSKLRNAEPKTNESTLTKWVGEEGEVTLL